MLKQAQTNPIEKQTALILFGSTGDLALGKLIPALFSLYKNGLLESGLAIICIGRKPYTTETYRDFIIQQFRAEHGFSRTQEHDLRKFLSQIHYVCGDPTKKETYISISSALEYVFPLGKISLISYLAVPQEVHLSITKHLAIVIFKHKRFVCRYIAIEKPFGYDRKSAQKLFEKLTEYISKKYLVFLDHYLYKRPIIEFEKLLREKKLYVGGNKINSNEITGVHAMLEEIKKVEHRLDFYDKVGALRDVGQNHGIQMLLSVLSLGGDVASKIKEIKSLFLSKEAAPVFRSYEGYKGSPMTETYFKVKLQSKSRIWRKAHLYISGGKGLGHNKSGIEITILGNQKFFINANASDKDKHGAYSLLLKDLLYGAPQRVSIKEILLSWEICEEILKKK